MKYEEMSDFEINKLVALASGKNIKFISVDVDDNEIGVIVGKKHTRQQLPFDPCNNPADAWPIIDENNITIINDHPSMRLAVNDAAEYYNGFSGIIASYDENGLRAAMIVFLKIQEKAQ